MTANEPTESFSVTIASPIQVWILVTHYWALYGGQELDNR
jgi:hypothetical protein